MMSAEIESDDEESGMSLGRTIALRLIVTLLLGGLALALFGVAARDRARPRKRGQIMTVEEAVRWRSA